MNDVNKKLNVPIEWAKAKEAFQEAQVLMEKNLASGTISRVYYAAFHSGKTLLLTEGLEIKSHQALGRLFSLHFVKTEKFDVRFSRILSKAQKFREEADYSSEFVFSLDDAKERLQEVGEFMSAAEGYLKAEGYSLP